MDVRLIRYRKAIESLRKNDFDISIPIERLDEIGEIGQSLIGLARSLRNRMAEHEHLVNIIDKVNAGIFLEDVLEHIYNSFRPVIPYNRIGCSLLDKGGSLVRAIWSASDANERYLQNGFTAKIDGSSLQTILDTGRPRIINDLGEYLEIHPHSESTRLIVQEGMRSSLTCPLIAQDVPVGFLFFSSREVGAYRDIHQETFMRLANQVSMVVEKSKLYQQVIDLNKRLLETQKALEEQATHDALTGLWNRRAITNLLAQNLARAKREKASLAVFIVDIDHFKQINDGYGHQVGDMVLQRAAKQLKAAARESDFVGRYGGEEFVVVAFPCNEQEAALVGERLLEKIRQAPLLLPDHARPIRITVSAGYATNDEDPIQNGEKLLNRADQALYRAKAGGRDRIEPAD